MIIQKYFRWGGGYNSSELGMPTWICQWWIFVFFKNKIASIFLWDIWSTCFYLHYRYSLLSHKFKIDFCAMTSLQDMKEAVSLKKRGATSTISRKVNRNVDILFLKLIRRLGIYLGDSNKVLLIMYVLSILECSCFVES